MEKVILKKSYARDFSLAVEQLWIDEFKKNIAERYGFKNPYEPYAVLYVTDENLEIWEHEKAISYFQDWLLKKNQGSSIFMAEVIQEYTGIVAELEKYWERGGIADIAVIHQYLEESRDVFTLFCLWYYACIDERTPEPVKKMVHALREKDELFARSDKFFKECVEALDGNRQLANLILKSEFPDKLPSEETLLSRATGIVTIDGDKVFFSRLTDFSATYPEYVFEDMQSSVGEVSELKGQVAYKGTVTGTVKIVKNVRAMEHVKKDDILVSPMTTPDFLPAMKLAAAFVTDEGGMMCHGAIVAREMKKPCIIGTKFATQILHDGDLVEVDANNGVVRILT
jgi:phosphoenolpyruvate synthase/pyruvate phosphate dikinase